MKNNTKFETKFKPTSVNFTKGDLRRIERIKKYYGISSRSEAIRRVIHLIAEKTKSEEVENG